MSEIKTLIPENLEHEEILRHEAYFSGIAKTETHALTFALMAYGNGPYSRSDLRKEFVAAQGPQPAWGDISSNVNFKYSTESFERVGLTDTRYETRYLFNRRDPAEVLVTDVVAPEEDVTFTLAEIGALLSWSAENDSIGLRHLFGEDRKGAQYGGGTLARKNIIKTALGVPGASEAEIAEILDIPRTLLNGYLSKLLMDGVLIREEAMDWDKRSFRLNGRGFQHSAIKRDELRSETRAVYDMIDILVASGSDEITAAELFDMTLKAVPELDVEVLKEVIAHALTSETIYFQGGRQKKRKSIPSLITDGPFNTGHKTKYFINPEHEDSLKELFNHLDSIELGDDEELRHWADQALDIVSDPSRFNTLVAKARQTSPQASVLSDAELLRRIDQVVQEAPLSVKGLAAALAAKGVIMSTNGLDSKVRELHQQGKLGVESKRAHNKSKAVIRFVTGITPPGNTTSTD